MIHTVIEQESIYPLDCHLNKIDGLPTNAFAQLEIYHTDKSRTRNVGVVNAYNNKFAYNIGDDIDVINRITVNSSIWLGNAAMTPFLQRYIDNERHNRR